MSETEAELEEPDRLTRSTYFGERKSVAQSEAGRAPGQLAGAHEMTGSPEGVPAYPDDPVKYVAVTRDDLVTPRGWQVATPRRNERLVAASLAALDVVAILIALLFSVGVRHDTWQWTPAIVLAAMLPGWLAAVKASGLYDRDSDLLGHSTIDELPQLARIATIGCWVFLLVVWAVTGRRELAEAAVLWGALLVLLPLLRIVVRPAIRATDGYDQNTIVVGAGSVGQLIGRKLLTHPEYHINLVGFVDAMPKERREDLETLTLLGDPEDLAAIVSEYQVERVIIAFSNDPHQRTMELIRLLKDMDVRIDIVPRLFDIIPPRVASHTIEGIPLITLPRLRLSPWSRFEKRSFDLAVAAALITLLAPVFILTALLIKLDSRGPVFFRQRRVGSEGKAFRIFKFRTMVLDADAQKHEIAHLNAHAAPGGDPRMFKVKDDPRITTVGALLRRYSLDELPQLFNVLLGEMSLIGPRPLILEEDRHVESWARKRLTLKPGMTGLWQVSGRSSIPFEDMVKLDYLYVTTWSLGGDIRLLLQTVPLVARGEQSVW
jgi:exopolysaccharide biosynthesis polyprenyl glycosylphosphotransferase